MLSQKLSMLLAIEPRGCHRELISKAIRTNSHILLRGMKLLLALTALNLHKRVYFTRHSPTWQV